MAKKNELTYFGVESSANFLPLILTSNSFAAPSAKCLKVMIRGQLNLADERVWQDFVKV